jgi:hypothetical protein
MRVRQQSSLGGQFIVPIILFATTVGCQSVDLEWANPFAEPGGDPSQVAETVPDGPTFQVEIREEGRQSQLTRMPLQNPMYVQQVLERSGALSRYNRVKVEIYRQLPEGGGHRLDVAFDQNTHRIPPSSDYAIHPDDRVVITEDRSTILDDMLESIGGPLSNLKQ